MVGSKERSEYLSELLEKQKAAITSLVRRSVSPSEASYLLQGIAQQAFLVRAYQAIESFDPSQGEFDVWTTRSGLNGVRDEIRRMRDYQSRNVSLESLTERREAAFSHISVRDIPTDEAVASRDNVERFAERLPTSAKTVLRLIYSGRSGDIELHCGCCSKRHSLTRDLAQAAGKSTAWVRKAITTIRKEAKAYFKE